jgi:hypothetical protein
MTGVQSRKDPVKEWSGLLTSDEDGLRNCPQSLYSLPVSTTKQCAIEGVACFQGSFVVNSSV